MNGRERPTSEVPRVNGGWRNIPLTAGLLVALVVAVGYLVNAMWQLEARGDTKRQASILHHDTNANAHRDIRRTVKAVNGLRSDIDGERAARRRDRRDRRELMRLLKEKVR